MQQQQQPQQHQQEAATAADVAERARQNTQTNTAHAKVVKDRTYAGPGPITLQLIGPLAAILTIAIVQSVFANIYCYIS